MTPVTILIALLPTIVLLGLLDRLSPNRLGSEFVWVGLGFGMLVVIPVWLIETPIENLGNSLSNRYLRLFVQQVLGAAVVEETLVALGLLAVCLCYRGILSNRRKMLAAAVSLAIGFTTIENAVAVYAAEDRFAESLARLLTIPAGHGSLQLMMGYFAANWMLFNQNRIRNGILLLIIPIAIHGWGDYAEALFHEDAIAAADAIGTKLSFSCWIFSLFAYFMGAVIVLWTTWASPRTGNGH